MRKHIAGFMPIHRLTRLAVGIAAAVPLCAAPGAMAQTQTGTPASTGIEEVLVTATRRAELLSDVPISVTSFGDVELQQRGVKQFDDLVRLTPGLNLTRQSATGANQIAIRGISSNAGSGTTGLYIDDTPIQVRNMGFGSGNAFPGLFDIERVEVLRGPQGTLFGAGSEGGTVRFIQTQPNFDEASGTARGEVGSTENGDESYEAGVAYGMPLTDRIAVRGSAYYRRDGGFVDAVSGTYSIVDPTGVSGGDSVDFTKTTTHEEDINWTETQAFRLAMSFKATENLTITPSIFYQKHQINDGAGAGTRYDVSLSDVKNADYARHYFTMGAPGTVYTFPNTTNTVTLNEMSAPEDQEGEDEFTLAALALDWDLGWAQLFSNTSYFDREEYQWFDYTKGYAQFYSPEFFTEADGVTNSGTYVPDGWKSMSQYNNEQQNFVQEIRLQSSDDDARLRWVAGIFYSDQDQKAEQPINQNFLINSTWVGFYPTGFDYGYYAVDGGDPFGPGSTAYQNFFGDDALANGVSFLGQWQSQEEQTAAFAQIDFDITDTITLTAGIRAAENKLDFDAAYLGPENNASAPFGFPGGVAPSYPLSSSSTKETSYTPKWGISWEPTEDYLVYAIASKGFRPAGASLRVPAICDFELIDKGYVDENGDPIQPETYESDSVWSYELGSKGRLFDGRLSLDGSVYHIEWSDIQSNISLPSCAYNFVDNLGDATSEGFDLAFQFMVSEQFMLSGAYGYNDPSFDKDVTSPGGTLIHAEDEAVPEAGAPQTVSLTGEYTLPIGAYEGYARLDYTYSAQWRRDDEEIADPRLKPTEAYTMTNLRLGARMDTYDVSFFVQNLTNEAPKIDYTAGGYYDPQDWSDIAIRPRTFGLTVVWRQ